DAALNTASPKPEHISSAPAVPFQKLFVRPVLIHQCQHAMDGQRHLAYLFGVGGGRGNAQVLLEILRGELGEGETVTQEGPLFYVLRRAWIDHEVETGNGQSFAEVTRRQIDRLQIVEHVGKNLAAADGMEEFRAQG